MRTIEEVRGTLTGLQIAKQSKDVQLWIKEIKALAEDMMVQDYNAKGEEAVRALGVQKGLAMACMLEEIFLSTLKSREAVESQKIQNKLKI